ncbi:hypothetical protein BKA67DRAFT_414498 [Truncatella angustata]|uniref:Secreted protein n=1 Tax=Truncatella angustata TaxID=152316 RepID=A0A9P8RP09_9PEZI|nr:uncharacterized protein BKA67DRAFT_414498 [Truncatella angustata]KAH6646720.1 hypothetical protein BKA67DRAFT_414498 [Truncatella angustata]
MLWNIPVPNMTVFLHLLQVVSGNVPCCSVVSKRHYTSCTSHAPPNFQGSAWHHQPSTIPRGPLRHTGRYKNLRCKSCAYYKDCWDGWSIYVSSGRISDDCMASAHQAQQPWPGRQFIGYRNINIS